MSLILDFDYLLYVVTNEGKHFLQIYNYVNSQ